METSPVDQIASIWSGLGEARAVAARHGNRRVGTQHLLMVLLSGPDDEAARALRGSGVDRAAVDVALDAILGSGGPPRRPLGEDEVETSDRVIAVLADAGARRDGREIGDHDVLAALMDSDDMSVARMIVSYIGARREVLARLDAAQTRR